MPYFEIYMPPDNMGDALYRRQWRRRDREWYFMDWTDYNPAPTDGLPTPESFPPRHGILIDCFHVVSYEEILALIAQTRAAIALRA